MCDTYQWIIDCLHFSHQIYTTGSIYELGLEWLSRLLDIKDPLLFPCDWRLQRTYNHWWQQFYHLLPVLSIYLRQWHQYVLSAILLWVFAYLRSTYKVQLWLNPAVSFRQVYHVHNQQLSWHVIRLKVDIFMSWSLDSYKYSYNPSSSTWDLHACILPSQMNSHEQKELKATHKIWSVSTHMLIDRVSSSLHNCLFRILSM